MPLYWKKSGNIILSLTKRPNGVQSPECNKTDAIALKKKETIHSHASNSHARHALSSSAAEGHRFVKSMVMAAALAE